MYYRLHSHVGLLSADTLARARQPFPCEGGDFRPRGAKVPARRLSTLNFVDVRRRRLVLTARAFPASVSL